ncbi:MAG: RDD family protein [Dehalococcoidia bacterium]
MRVDTISEQAIARAAINPGEHAGTLRARVGGYVVDMVIFAAIAMLVIVAAGAMILLRTDGAVDDPTDAEYYSFFTIIALGTPLVWSLLNLALLVTRGQTGGQYVAGLRTRSADGEALRPVTALAWWFCFNPLLFSWPMALVAGIPLAALLFLVLNVFALFVLTLVVLVCVAAPIVAFVSALLDADDRALHDRVAGTVVLPVSDR